MMKLILALTILFSINVYGQDLDKATFAGGCFWCMEPPFEKLVGVKEVISGYAGGVKANPTYEQVSSGTSGHLEVVQVIYDPTLVSYEHLLEIFWMNVDPTDSGGQFVDRGEQYGTAIFYHNEEQKRLADLSKQQLEREKIFGKKIVTPLRALAKFYPAEDYHQDYYKKSLVTKAKYKYYRSRSGRDDFLEKYWTDKKFTFLRDQGRYQRPSKKELKKKLTAIQFEVTQEEGTEPPFKNEFWNSKKEGIYIDVVTGEPLFSSKDKFKSGTGWPSFVRPLDPYYIIEKRDDSFGMERIEVVSRYGKSHLGHVFRDGPAPTGLRYCINSASLEFIPREELREKGFGHYEKLFKK